LYITPDTKYRGSLSLKLKTELSLDGDLNITTISLLGRYLFARDFKFFWTLPDIDPRKGRTIWNWRFGTVWIGARFCMRMKNVLTSLSIVDEG